MYPSQYSQGYEGHDEMAAMFLARAERVYGEFEAELVAASAACP
jgi:hypothetical protein